MGSDNKRPFSGRSDQRLKRPLVARRHELADEAIEMTFQFLFLGFSDLCQSRNLLACYNVPQRGGFSQPHQADALIFWGTGACYA